MKYTTSREAPHPHEKHDCGNAKLRSCHDAVCSLTYTLLIKRFSSGSFSWAQFAAWLGLQRLLYIFRYPHLPSRKSYVYASCMHCNKLGRACITTLMTYTLHTSRQASCCGLRFSVQSLATMVLHFNGVIEGFGVIEKGGQGH
jgi:hypothetical protein